MEEKILIKSKLSEKTKKVFLGMAIGFAVIAVLIFAVTFIDQYNHLKRLHYEDGVYEYCVNSWLAYYYDTFFKLILKHTDVFPIGPFIVLFSGLLISLFIFITYKCYLKSTLTVTEKNVIGRTLFGKKVTLPIHQIAAYSTRSLFSKIIVSSPSGNTAFTFIENYEDIGNVLANLINKRQEDTTIKSDNGTKNDTNNLDDLKKLKELLDNGIISQEEFEAKKKEILGI